MPALVFCYIFRLVLTQHVLVNEHENRRADERANYLLGDRGVT